MLGFPIRTPSDHSSVDSSPRPIAASHVLHRLLMPRHPPCALKHLITTRCSHPLCNTQHTTTSPTHHDHHHPKLPSGVRRSKPGAARKNTRTNRVSSQDPTVCQAIHHLNRSQCSTQPHPPTHPQNRARRPLTDAEFSERRTRPPSEWPVCPTTR